MTDKICQMDVVTDPNVPRGYIEIRTRDGELLSRLKFVDEPLFKPPCKIGPGCRALTGPDMECGYDRKTGLCNGKMP